MRVISGTAKGHRLKTPEGRNTRPTADKIKESLFNIIAPDIEDCEFLDLFCGSGAIGIEALSRGAKNAVFVDNSYESIKAVSYNVDFTKLSEKAHILKKDVFAAITVLGKEKKCFDIIFIDPPYEGGFNEAVLDSILKAGILKPDGYIILERSITNELKALDGLQIRREKHYKTTIMTFLMLEEYKC